MKKFIVLLLIVFLSLVFISCTEQAGEGGKEDDIQIIDPSSNKDVGQIEAGDEKDVANEDKNILNENKGNKVEIKNNDDDFEDLSKNENKSDKNIKTGNIKENESASRTTTKPSNNTIKKDTTKPVFSGVKDRSIEYGAKIDLKKGITAKDDVDGDITSKISISGSVDSKKAGDYKITYTVSDKAGNKTTATRIITVKAYDGKDNPSGRDKSLENWLISSSLLKTGSHNYQSAGGEKVKVFDDYFNKLVNGSMSVSQVKSALKGMSWQEQNHLTNDPNSVWNYSVLKINACKITTSKTSRDDILWEIRQEMDTGRDYSKVYAYWNNNTKKYTIVAMTMSLE